MNRLIVFATPVLALMAQGAAYANLITSAAGILSPSVTIDFSQFAGANAVTVTGPVEVGSLAGVDVTLQSTNPDGSILGSGPYSFADNGMWDETLSFAGLDVDLAGSDLYTMTFLFKSGPVAQVGGFLNYSIFDGSGFADATISVLGKDNSVLESYDLSTDAPISTPGGLNEGAFRGISRSQADIYGFSLSNSAIAIADLTFGSPEEPPPTTEPNPVPESGSLLVVAGAALLLNCARRNYAASKQS